MICCFLLVPVFQHICDVKHNNNNDKHNKHTPPIFSFTYVKNCKCNQSESCIHNLSTKSDTFSMGVGLRSCLWGSHGAAGVRSISAYFYRWCGSVGFIRPSAHTGVVWGWVWRGRDENQHLQKSWFSAGKWWITASGLGVSCCPGEGV